MNESAIVKYLAEAIFRCITTRTVRDLQGIDITLPGDDTVLANCWDEICVRQQPAAPPSVQAALPNPGTIASDSASWPPEPMSNEAG